MIPEAEALARILSAVEPLPVESVTLEKAAGRFAADDLRSPTPLPRFDQSSMDGYAIRAVDTPGTLQVVGEQPAGAARALRIGPREAVRIFTGAPLPTGADAVVMQEDVVVEGSSVSIEESIPVAEFIRRRGGDVCEGQQLVARGDLLTAPRIGVLCAAGIPDIPVHRFPVAGIISTGDELRPIGTPLQPGELHDSNAPMLAAQLSAAADIAGTKRTSDDPAELAEAILGFPTTDAIVISAGVSVGDHDPVHETLRELGAKVDFWRVAIKPGKPFLCARLGLQWIFALPGNPVSAFVTAKFFVVPALRRLAGAPIDQCAPRSFPISLGTSLENPDVRPHYVRAIIQDGRAFPTPLQQSHALAGLAAADVLVRIESCSFLNEGDMVPAFPLNFR
ncbi:MAG TPA: gephyrin-like molybdotransferase Glp [Chthoniobacterales bacterium]|nr:gephyrin-like molybdotransferase Glp [Chthoniobacterales bacterium]